MRSERGLTLSSVIIYVIAMLLVVSIISVITGYFYKNVNTDLNKNSYMEQYTKFNSYFSEEVNKEGNKVIEAGTKEENQDGVTYKTNFIAFSDGTCYTYSEANKSIYKDDMKICTGIDTCTFNSTVNEKMYTIKVEFKAGNFSKIGSNALTYYIRL